MAEAIAVFKNDSAYSKKITKERLRIDDVLVQEETQRTYLNYVPRVPYPNRAGIALIKNFLEKREPQLGPSLSTTRSTARSSVDLNRAVFLAACIRRNDPQ